MDTLSRLLNSLELAACVQRFDRFNVDLIEIGRGDWDEVGFG
ncbi:hypothetical protein RBWH47_05107 [Rhodopirellula baltica WH47]|uniref:Uncharacterized protein n=1 Tax=Rhodopirellula baltica WH47 TaxID=991778 RepID=F2AQI8_RHOBT|nr:hypothetical protein RBWH47_05107 [Rhodopirellula baltica WH47]